MTYLGTYFIKFIVFPKKPTFRFRSDTLYNIKSSYGFFAFFKLPFILWNSVQIYYHHFNHQIRNDVYFVFPHILDILMAFSKEHILILFNNLQEYGIIIDWEKSEFIWLPKMAYNQLKERWKLLWVIQNR